MWHVFIYWGLQHFTRTVPNWHIIPYTCSLQYTKHEYIFGYKTKIVRRNSWADIWYSLKIFSPPKWRRLEQSDLVVCVALSYNILHKSQHGQVIIYLENCTMKPLPQCVNATHLHVVAYMYLSSLSILIPKWYKFSKNMGLLCCYVAPMIRYILQPHKGVIVTLSRCL